MWKTLIYIVIFISYIQDTVCQTYQMSGVYTQQAQLKNSPNQRQALVGSLLSSYLANKPMPERIDIITSVLQRTPAKCASGKTSKRHELVEILKMSALQSLNVASNACKNFNEIRNIPAEYSLPMPLRNQLVVRRSACNELPKTVQLQYNI